MASLLDRPTQLAFRTLNSVLGPLVTSGAVSPPPIGLGLVMVETTGRVTGQTSQVPLLATRFGSRVTVSTVRRRSQWVRNLEADPNSAVWLAGRRRPATASVRRGPLDVVSLDVGKPDCAATCGGADRPVDAAA